MGSRMKSPLLVKQEMANARERRIEMRTPRDDGFLRRTDREPISCDEQRMNSRKRKVYIPAWVRFKHERFVRARMDATAQEAREALLPMDWYRPGGQGYCGTVQEGDKE